MGFSQFGESNLIKHKYTPSIWASIQYNETLFPQSRKCRRIHPQRLFCPSGPCFRAIINNCWYTLLLSFISLYLPCPLILSTYSNSGNIDIATRWRFISLTEIPVGGICTVYCILGSTPYSSQLLWLLHKSDTEDTWLKYHWLLDSRLGSSICYIIVGCQLRFSIEALLPSACIINVFRWYKRTNAGYQNSIRKAWS